MTETELESDLFVVVLNQEDQYSIWQEGRAVPSGWRVLGDAAPKSDCLARIDDLWTDLRPRSLRTALGDS
jgi:MbtH protein